MVKCSTDDLAELYNSMPRRIVAILLKQSGYWLNARGVQVYGVFSLECIYAYFCVIVFSMD